MFEHKLNVEELIKRCESNWSLDHHDAGATAVRLIRAGDIVMSHSRKWMEQFELTPAEFDTLATLRKLGEPFELMPSQLCKANLLSSGGLTKVLKNLEARQLIERDTHEADKRSRIIRLSESGRELVDQLGQRIFNAHENFFGQIYTEEERRQLNTLLSKLHNRVAELP